MLPGTDFQGNKPGNIPRTKAPSTAQHNAETIKVCVGSKSPKSEGFQFFGKQERQKPLRINPTAWMGLFTGLLSWTRHKVQKVQTEVPKFFPQGV